jgi:hypothetical protein
LLLIAEMTLVGFVTWQVTSRSQRLVAANH